MQIERDLKKRTFNFAKRAIVLINKLPKNLANEILGSQFLKAATSIGANYREADAAESARDFLHKIGVVTKEAKEAFYWLGLLQFANESILTLKEEFNWLIKENEELIKIFSKISINVKSKLKNPL